MLVGVGAAAVRGCLVRVAGASMAPALDAGDLAVVLPVRLGRLAVGDVVVLVDPAGREVVKRVAALAGEWSDVMDGPILVPSGHVAVRGDNRPASTDSRHYGPVALDAVRGRVWAAVGGAGPRVRFFRSRRVQAPV